jgi:hypothetical protein
MHPAPDTIFQAIRECLLGRPALALKAMIGPVIVIVGHELIQISRKRIHCAKIKTSVKSGFLSVDFRETRKDKPEGR